MMRFDAVIALFPDLDASELTVWVERRWVQPEGDTIDLWVFQDVDIARVHLIYDLRRNLDTSEETLPLVLSLLDHVYDLRRKMKAVMQVVENQPKELQQSILSILRDPE